MGQGGSGTAREEHLSWGELPFAVYVAEPGSEALAWVSPGIEALLGHDAAELLSKSGNLRGLLRGGERERIIRARAQAELSGETMTVEYRIEHPQRGGRWIEEIARLAGGPNGARRWQGLLLDVTARHEVDATRLASLKSLAEALAQRDELLAVAAHELRSPLTALQLELQAIARSIRRAEPLESGRVGELAERALRQVRRVSRLGDALFDLTRLSLGQLELDRQEMDLVAVVRAAVELHARTAPPVRVSAPPQLAGTWDAVRLGQVITNLVSNALKYGAPPVEVEVLDGDGARIVVRDHGRGIPPELRPRLFERFARGDRRSASGLGLGLYITREIVHAHGGTIALASGGAGTEFIVHLPRLQA